MKIGDTGRDDFAFGVLPRPLADAVAGVDAGGTARCCRREVGVPDGGGGACGFGQGRAVGIGTFKAAEVGTVALA